MGRGRAIAPTGFTQNYSKRIGDESKDIEESDGNRGIQWNLGIQRNWKNPKILMNPMKNRGIRGTGGDQME